MTLAQPNDALEAAKLDALKELAYGASHEINNPLANIAARAQTLLRDEADPERRRALEAIHEQALRAHEMISDLMLFARPPRLDRQQVNISQMLERVKYELAEECRRRTINLQLRTDPRAPHVMADAAQLTVAVKALVANAIEAIGHRGRVDLGVELIADGSTLQIAVHDNGPGVSPATRPHIFDPFFSGREAGRGLGFGLSKCWRIVREHGGNVTVCDNFDGGATFTIELPLQGVDL
jgi:signal transduction histidine kinase